jgi:hypothetical protein
VGFDVTAQLPVRMSAFVRCWITNVNTVRHYISYVRFEVFMAVTMKNDILWDGTHSGSCNNGRCGGTFLHHQGDKKQEARNNISSN